MQLILWPHVLQIWSRYDHYLSQRNPESPCRKWTIWRTRLPASRVVISAWSRYHIGNIGSYRRWSRYQPISGSPKAPSGRCFLGGGWRVFFPKILGGSFLKERHFSMVVLKGGRGGVPSIAMFSCMCFSCRCFPLIDLYRRSWR